MFRLLGLIVSMFMVKEVVSNCVTFYISSEIGCNWMCNYCANQLSTDNYYFINNICTYQNRKCIGNPQTGISYTCCSMNDKDEL